MNLLNAFVIALVVVLTASLVQFLADELDVSTVLISLVALVVTVAFLERGRFLR